MILPARGARFDVVSGDVRFIVTPPGATGESLAITTTAVSDQNGVVRVRLRALPGAAPQNALIQITDPETLAFQRVVVPITHWLDEQHRPTSDPARYSYYEFGTEEFGYGIGDYDAYSMPSYEDH